MNYDPDIHHRRSVRLKGYDYSLKGLYFITICTQNNRCLFGDITDGVISLNEAGKMIESWYHEIPNKFPDYVCLEHMVMPNHFHCIWMNKGETGQNLIDVIHWFKTMTTNEYIRNVHTNNWLPFNKRLWQREYFEHIIPNQHAYQEIADYILSNPLKWSNDKYFVK